MFRRKPTTPQQRANHFRQLAYDLDMAYTPDDEWGVLHFLEDFNLFRRKRRKKITNMLYGIDAWHETKLYIFDYRYRQSKNKYHHQTVFFINSKSLALPKFFMQPEHIFHKLAGYFGFEDIDFVEYPKFSNQYHLKGDDDEWVRTTFDNNIIRFFTIEKNWYLEGIGYYMVLYKQNTLFSPRTIKDFYKKGLTLAQMLSVEPLG